MTKPVVVVAEDDPSIRALLVMELEGRGYVVHSFENGQEALAGVRSLRPDAVVMDQMMPVLDGNAVLAAIRDDAAIAHTVVILVTARADGEAITEAFEMGADDYITKPFHADEIDRSLRSLLASP